MFFVFFKPGMPFVSCSSMNQEFTIFQGSMEIVSRWSLHQIIHMHMSMFWVCIMGRHLSLALIILPTRKPKYLIILQSNGILLQIIHLVLDLCKYRIKCSFKSFLLHFEGFLTMQHHLPKTVFTSLADI